MITGEKNLSKVTLFKSLLTLAGIFLLSCSGSIKDLTITRKGDIWFRNTGISLKFDRNMYCSVYYLNAENPLNYPGKGTVPSRPNHYLIVNGKEVTDFAVDYDGIESEIIETESGKGKRLIIRGIAEKEDEYRIEKTLRIDYYEKYPDVAIIEAIYRNLGKNVINVEKEYSCCFRMDASTMNSENKPYDFWSFQGSSLNWGIDYIIRITEGFRQDNYMGVQPVTKTGGGVPVVDLWTREAGLAIAHLENKPQLVSFPVETGPDNRVTMSICDDKGTILNPGESFASRKTAVIAHQLDFYTPLKTYSDLMADNGLKRNKSSEEAYEAIWCGWGYLTDFTLDEIYGTLPKLKELGIKWVVIDDRWWDRYGDWNPRKYTFPGGEKQVREFVDSLHRQGFKVKIWWAPTPVQPEEMISWSGSVDPGMAEIAKQHPDWLIMDKDGSYPRDCRDMYQLCPGLPEVQDYMIKLTERFIRTWGYDGHKLDAYYVVSPCYNPKHNHKYPAESYEKLPLLLKAIYETSKSIKPYSVTEICNCGTTQDFFQSVYSDQPVNSDPTSTRQSRQRVKVLKALWGPSSPVFTDHVEHIRPWVDMNDKSDTATLGQDFASSMGPGGVIGTKFTWPGGPENVRLTGEKELHWKKWFDLYRQKMLSKGTYINLYDVIYDKPETHLISKGDTLYYAFYADEWKGDIELRGLKNRKYNVFDYENRLDMGIIKGPKVNFAASFKGHLLIECIPSE
ncbi:MAG: alpha-galactosidase [Bacteroidales bacterium]|nr:alpha-galactosidase [Bacteroidales bacterium]